MGTSTESRSHKERRGAIRSPAGADERPTRVVIENVTPAIDSGRFPTKRVIGEAVNVSANIFTDGHDKLAAVLRFRKAEDTAWHEVPMEPLVNDAWTAEFTVTELGTYRVLRRGMDRPVRLVARRTCKED